MDFDFTQEKLLSYQCDAEMLDDSGPNWKYCMEHATFAHREACEFILHIGVDSDGYWISEVEGMKAAGCTEDFIVLYLAAKDKGAERLLVWA